MKWSAHGIEGCGIKVNGEDGARCLYVSDQLLKDRFPHAVKRKAVVAAASENNWLGQPDNLDVGGKSVRVYRVRRKKVRRFHEIRPRDGDPVTAKVSPSSTLRTGARTTLLSAGPTYALRPARDNQQGCPYSSFCSRWSCPWLKRAPCIRSRRPELR